MILVRSTEYGVFLRSPLYILRTYFIKMIVNRIVDLEPFFCTLNEVLSVQKRGCKRAKGPHPE